MAVVELEDLVYTSMVTLAACFQLAQFARRVGRCRQKFKINPPEIGTEPEFQRTFRAQQNCLEFFPIFLPILWIASLFLHQVPASVLGILYVISREQYFNGYSKDPKQRLGGFKWSVRCLQGLLLCCLLGLGNTLLHRFCGINIGSWFSFH